MAITLTDDAKKRSIASLTRFCGAEFDLELSQIQAAALLDFVLKEIAPSVYNGAIADARAFLGDRLGDMEATCFEGEFTYWPKGSSVRRKG